MRTTFRPTELARCLWMLAIWGCADPAVDPDANDAGISDFQDKGLAGSYEAENHTFQSGCTKSSQHPGYSGSGYMDFGGISTIVEWNNINAPSAGEYTLVFRYANGTTAGRPCAITVNDTNEVGDVAFAATEGWSTWSTVSIKVTLRQGINKVRVTAKANNGGPNLDKLDLNSDITTTTGECASTDELSTLKLSCASGQTINAITFSSYGTPTSCPNPATASCSASNSKAKVESLCLNKQTCTVSASNDVFGDPCAGVRKRLAVRYTCGATTTPPPTSDATPVFLMAGQSNMVGNVDAKLFDGLLYELGTGSSSTTQDRLKSRLSNWYLNNNGGYASYGYSDAMATFESSELIRLKNAGLVGDFLKTPLANILCAMNTSQLNGLTTNCGSIFGPELGFGHFLKSKGYTSTSLIKVAEGGTTLYSNWRSPKTVAQSGGSVGPLYTQLQARIDSLKSSPTSVHASCATESCRWGGFVWFQGENDSMDQTAANAYAKNLANLIADVRGRVGSSTLPVVVVEIGKWAQSMSFGAIVRSAQRSVVAADTNTRLVKTDDLSGFYHYDPAAQLIIGERVGIALTSMLGGGGSDGCPSDPNKTTPGVCGCGVADTDTDRDGTADCKDACKNDAAKTSPGACGCGVAEGTCGGAATPSANHLGGYQGPVTSGGFVPSQYNAGFSMYVAAWPLFKTYPGTDSQSGLLGTWMGTQAVANPPLANMYSDIEGGLGWWRNTRFAIETPKFIMGGVALNFSSIANGPGAGTGPWDKPSGVYGVAQLSPWVLFPPDGLNLKRDTSGELFGYGYLPLPLTNPKTVTAGKNVATGNQCWTLFLNTGNFKGPLAFFLPYFFSQPAVSDPRLSGLFLDSGPADPNGSIAMETQHTPAAQSTTSDGRTFARVAPLLFPSEADGTSSLVHNLYYYQKSALWDKVATWFAGGAAANGAIDPNAHFHRAFSTYNMGLAIWENSFSGGVRKEISFSNVQTPSTNDPYSSAIHWNRNFVAQISVGGKPFNMLPEYYSLNRSTGQWNPVKPDDVPANSGLQNYQFPVATRTEATPYTTPDGSATVWKSPGPKAGPFYAYPGDGSKVTYYWYRFADQPAMLNADMTAAEREVVQQRVEMIHRSWTKERNYLAPPAVAKSLAQIDPALVVNPPLGLEVGYVPIVTRQESAN